MVFLAAAVVLLEPLFESYIQRDAKLYRRSSVCFVALFATVYSQPPVSYLQLEMNNNSVSLLVLAVLVVAAVHYFGGIGTGTGRPPHSAKTSWPELVGKKGEKAKAIIERETKGVNVEILDENASATEDFRTDRVRIRVNKKGIVTKTPRIG